MLHVIATVKPSRVNVGVMPAQPAPALGQHTREVLESLLGYSTAEVDELAAAKVVQLG